MHSMENPHEMGNSEVTGVYIWLENKDSGYSLDGDGFWFVNALLPGFIIKMHASLDSA